jgi:hypothetical protein
MWKRISLKKVLEKGRESGVKFETARKMFAKLEGKALVKKSVKPWWKFIEF